VHHRRVQSITLLFASQQSNGSDTSWCQPCNIHTDAWHLQESNGQACKGAQESPQEKVSQSLWASSQAQIRSTQAQADSILQESLPQIRDYDCDFFFLIPSKLFKALIYCNGQLVQELYDHYVVDLTRRLKDRLIELDATSHSPLTEAVQWATEHILFDCPDTVIQIQDSKGKCHVFDSSKQGRKTKLSVWGPYY